MEASWPTPVSEGERRGGISALLNSTAASSQQTRQIIAAFAKVNLIANFMRHKADNISRCLKDALANLLAKFAIDTNNAIRATFNRIELHEMLNSEH